MSCGVSMALFTTRQRDARLQVREGEPTWNYNRINLLSVLLLFFSFSLDIYSIIFFPYSMLILVSSYGLRVATKAWGVVSNGGDGRGTTKRNESISPFVRGPRRGVYLNLDMARLPPNGGSRKAAGHMLSSYRCSLRRPNGKPTHITAFGE